MVLQNNVFVERVLPGSILRDLDEEEMTVYRAPYLEPGESRRPTLTWPREIPIEGTPADVTEIVRRYAEWMSANDLPKLFVNAEPGAILTGAQREFCRGWGNQEEVTVAGAPLHPGGFPPRDRARGRRFRAPDRRVDRGEPPPDAGNSRQARDRPGFSPDQTLPQAKPP